MKAAPFAHVRAESLDHALDLLAAYGGEAKPIAGGQSLVPMMALRLARPALLVDINRLPALKGVAIGAQCAVMGATTRQRAVEKDVALHRAGAAAARCAGLGRPCADAQPRNGGR